MVAPQEMARFDCYFHKQFHRTLFIKSVFKNINTIVFILYLVFNAYSFWKFDSIYLEGSLTTGFKKFVSQTSFLCFMENKNRIQNKNDAKQPSYFFGCDLIFPLVKSRTLWILKRFAYWEIMLAQFESGGGGVGGGWAGLNRWMPARSSASNAHQLWVLVSRDDCLSNSWGCKLWENYVRWEFLHCCYFNWSSKFEIPLIPSIHIVFK